MPPLTLPDCEMTSLRRSLSCDACIITPRKTGLSASQNQPNNVHVPVGSPPSNPIRDSIDDTESVEEGEEIKSRRRRWEETRVEILHQVSAKRAEATLKKRTGKNTTKTADSMKPTVRSRVISTPTSLKVLASKSLPNGTTTAAVDSATCLVNTNGEQTGKSQNIISSKPPIMTTIPAKTILKSKIQLSPPKLPKEFSRPPTSSKYDFVKVKVKITASASSDDGGTNENNTDQALLKSSESPDSSPSYILSRFLISRVLMATKIQPAHAIRIALDLKKRLVDRNLLTITQSQLEHELFLLMKRWGYGELNVRWYRMLSSFHHHRIPLILLIGGTKCLGKAALATQLAERLNLTGVLRTEVIAELMESVMNTDDVGIKKKPVWLRKFKTDHDFMEAWKQECQLVRRGLHADLTKCLKEGKSIIIVGSHVNHELINYVQQLISSECVSNDSATPAALADRKATDHLQPLPQYTKGILIPFLITLEDEQLHRQFVADFVDLMQDFRTKEWSFEGCDGSDSDETGQSYSRHTEVEQLYHRFRLIQDSLFSKSPKLKVLSSTVTLSPLSAETPKTSTLSHSSSTIQAAEKPSSKPQFLPALIPLNVRSSLITIDFMHTKVLEHLSSVFDSSPLSRPQSTPVRPHAQSLSHSVNIPRNSSKLTTGFTAPLTQDPSSRFHFPVKSMSSNEVNGVSTVATVHSVSSKNGEMEIVVPRFSGVTRRNTDFLPKTKSKT